MNDDIGETKGRKNPEKKDTRELVLPNTIIIPFLYNTIIIPLYVSYGFAWRA